MAVIDIRNISKTFKGKKGRSVQALSELSLAIEEGEVFGFLGPNGAGKSTTIKILMGLIRSTAGNASICGVPVGSPEARKKLGYLPENPSFYDFLTGREYLVFVAKSFEMEDAVIEREVSRVLELLSLTEAADRSMRGYSKGMVQRLGIAQALVHDPDIFILDEPMSGLDPIGRALVKDIIRELKRRGKTVFFSTHITSDVEIVCDRVGIVAGGLLLAVHDVEHLLQSGIDGYQVHASGCMDGLSCDFSLTAHGVGAYEAYVPRDRFQEFMEIVFKSGGSVELIEPRRKDLESYFLDIVGRKS